MAICMQGTGLGQCMGNGGRNHIPGRELQGKGRKRAQVIVGRKGVVAWERHGTGKNHHKAGMG